MSRFPLPRLLALMFALILSGCPPTNSKPCDTDTDCGAEGRCRRGACGPVCLNDTECGTEQICRSGSCIPAPECQADTDCAQGFVCKADKCNCTNDSAFHGTRDDEAQRDHDDESAHDGDERVHTRL